MKHLYALFALVVLVPFTALTQCLVVHVSPEGDAEASGTISDPRDLISAIAEAVEGTYLKLSTGDYTLSEPLRVTADHVTIEGGFMVANGWAKTTLPGGTRLHRNTENVEGQPLAPRLVGIELDGVTGFTMRDVMIEVAEAPQATAALPRGVSTYGVYINETDDYSFTRCAFIVGDASNGLDGQPHSGAGGAGGGGSGGFAGPEGVDCSNGQNGGQGQIGGPGGSAGALGTANPTGGCNLVNCDKNPSGGNNGGNGGSGTPAEINYVFGDQPAAVQPPLDPIDAPFYIPGGQQNGSNGNAGGGGGGGGGGTRGTCCLCNCGSGNGVGGAGGAGGHAGLGGIGGFGGGASFGAYVVNSTNGTFTDCSIDEGLFGFGGAGGDGQLGATGGTGQPGNTFTRCGETRSGGSGGNGGNGSAGGRGRDGANGVSGKLFIYGDAPDYFLGTQNVVIGEGFSNPSSFDLEALDVVQVSYNLCADDPFTLTHVGGNASSSWTFITDAGFVTLTGQTVDYTTGQLGGSVFSLNGTVYTDVVVAPCRADAGTTVDDGVITAVAEDAEYQWLDCGNDFAPIGGADGQVFAPEVSGSYAVQVSENGCTTIGACISITLVKVNELVLERVSVYPNPATSWVTVETDASLVGEIYSLFDTHGRLVDTGMIQSQTTVLEVGQFTRGTYLLAIGEGRWRIIKQ